MSEQNKALVLKMWRALSEFDSSQPAGMSPVVLTDAIESSGS